MFESGRKVGQSLDVENADSGFGNDDGFVEEKCLDLNIATFW